MSLIIDDRGAGNQLVLPADAHDRIHGRISVLGENCRVEIGVGCYANNLLVALASNCTVQIGTGCNLGNLFVHAGDGARLSIGSGSGFNGLVRFLMHEPREIRVGAGCLFAGDVDVTISDMHSIIDVVTGERVNPARDIIIEDRVWIGQRSMILKGAHIRSGSIVGACSLVSNLVPENCVAAGVPARVLRTGVTWRFELI